MKIAILMSLSSPWSREIAKNLARLNNSVRIIDFASHNSGQYLNTKDSFIQEELKSFYKEMDEIFLLKSKFVSKIKYFLLLFELRKYLKKTKPDILLALYGGGYGFMTYLSGFKPYVNYVVGDDVLIMNWYKKLIVPRMLENAAIVFGNGKYLCHQTAKLAPKANLISLYVGIDTNYFKPVRVKKSIGIKIICTRGFSPEYNNENIVLALSFLQEKYQNISVVFASKGPTLEYVKGLANRVLEKKMRENVQFLGGVSQEDLLYEIQDSDIYISMSRSDGASISLMEAMACDTYPIISDILPNREWLICENVSLIPLDQPEVLANKIEEVCSNNQARKAALKFNRKLILKECNIVENIKKMSDMMLSKVLN